jgi:putative ABC transport system permease protein
MKSILLITWANIKRRKIQTFLVTICIALAALLFSTLIGIGLGMSRPFENLYERLNASHILMHFNINEHNPTAIRNWFLEQEEVLQVSNPRIRRNHWKNLIYKGKELFNHASFWEYPGPTANQDLVHILEGEKKAYPDPGEIWIPNKWKSEEKIQLGDTLFLPSKYGLVPLLVSGIVVDAQHSNGLINPLPVWVGPGSLSLLFPINELSRITLGIQLKDAAETEKVWARFHQSYSYRGQVELYDFFKKLFQIIHQITGGLLLVFAIFGIIVTLIITSSVVNSAIKTDFKMIGVLKAQGFTNQNIISVYIIQFLLITCIAVPIGLIGGYFMTQLVFKDLISAVGAVNFDISLWLPSLATFFVFIIGILAITYRTAKQAGKILPVQAIRFGGPPQRSFVGSKFSLFTLTPRSRLPIFLGLRMLMSNKKRGFLLFVGLLFVIFVQILYTNANNSVLNLDDNRPAWGYTITD